MTNADMKQLVVDMDWVDLLTYGFVGFFSVIWTLFLAFSVFESEKSFWQIHPDTSPIRILACIFSVFVAFLTTGTLLRISAILCALTASVPIALSLSHANTSAISAASQAIVLLWIALLGTISVRCIIVLKRNMRLQ
ncbi:MAG TPA: hypothetical protein VJT08_02500 [Terriglobales bacterium]|nr:hypothetical protein [Terriglobales bacterium]